MKIEIKDGDDKVVFSNEFIDNENFVDVITRDVVVTLPVNEVYSAIKAFVNLQEEKRKLHE